MTREKILQSFKLDTTDILSNPQVLQHNDTILKDFLVEGYNPIIADLEKLYHENPSLDAKDTRLQEISYRIERQLQEIGGAWTDIRIKESLNPETILDGSGQSMPTHLAFVRRALHEGRNVNEIINGYNQKPGLAERITGQTIKDFHRIHFNLIDQNQQSIMLDNKPFAEAIDDRAKASGKTYIKEFQKALSLTDEQLKLIVSRFNQRGIEGAGMAIVTHAHGDGPRENNLYVQTDEAGKIKSVTAVENKYTVQAFAEDGIDEYGTSVHDIKVNTA